MRCLVVWSTAQSRRSVWRHAVAGGCSLLITHGCSPSVGILQCIFADVHVEVQERPRARIADQQFPIPDAERDKLANNYKLPRPLAAKLPASGRSTAGRLTLRLDKRSGSLNLPAIRARTVGRKSLQGQASSLCVRINRLIVVSA